MCSIPTGYSIALTLGPQHDILAPARAPALISKVGHSTGVRPHPPTPQNYLSIQPQKTMRATWTRSCGVSSPSKQDNAPNARYLDYSLLATGSLLGIRPALLGLWSFKATGCAFCADYGFLTFMEVPGMRGRAPLAPRPSFTMN